MIAHNQHDFAQTNYIALVWNHSGYTLIRRTYETKKVVSIGDINVANDLPFVLFGGMNVLESRDLAMRICEQLRHRYAEARHPPSSKPPLIKPTVPPSTPIVGRVWKKE